MIAGRLNEIIEIWRPTTTTNEFGEKEKTNSLIVTTRANVQNLNGSKLIENNEIVVVYNKVFTIRYYHNLTETDIIKWQGKNYKINTIEKRREYNDILINAEVINE